MGSTTEDEHDDHNDASDTELREKDDSAATALLSLGSGIPPQPDMGAPLPRRVIVRASFILGFLDPLVAHSSGQAYREILAVSIQSL